MTIFKDVRDLRIELTPERHDHIEAEHPEMAGQIRRIQQTLREPDRIVRSLTDPQVELFYRHYATTPVSNKYLCVVVKVLGVRPFVITAYFTDSIKKGEILWPRN